MAEQSTVHLRFVLWLGLFLAGILGAHFLAVATGGTAVNLQDALFAATMGYCVGWASHDTR